MEPDMKPVTDSKTEQVSQPANPPVSQKPVEPALIQGAKLPTPALPKPKISPRHRWYIAGIAIGALLLFVIGVIVFQPRAYLWLLARAGDPSMLSSTTDVRIDRSIVDHSAESGNFQDTIQVFTEASYVAPDNWWFTTNIISTGTDPQGEGIEAKIFGDEAFQRTAGSEDAFSTYEFQEGEYDSTVEAIKSSSFFQSGIVEYGRNPRFVWNPDGQPWWYAHYRFTVDVGLLTTDAPEWFDSSLYPFGIEESLGNQTITFFADVWVNPFTGKVMHETWDISKENAPGETYDVALKIFMDRAFTYPKELTIERPS